MPYKQSEAILRSLIYVFCTFVTQGKESFGYTLPKVWFHLKSRPNVSFNNRDEVTRR